MANFQQPAAFFESVSAVTATPSVEVGTVRDEGDEKYIYVYNNGATQISTGRGATVTGVTGYSVTVSTTTSTDLIVGVCKHATIAASSYGWLLVRGFSTCKAAPASALAAGDMLVVAADGAFTNKDISTGYVGPVVGKCVVATGASGFGDGFFNIL
jgi:hypothetical protein